jgi:uncharacterized protein
VNIPDVIAAELGVPLVHVSNALALFAEGATVPFIARYRKERTGEMNEIVLRQVFERNEYLTELEDRKSVIIKSIEEQGKLTEALRKSILDCMQKTELEDLYLPYKPKKRTRATIAKERGLEPLARWIQSQNVPESNTVDLNAEAAKFITGADGCTAIEEVLGGASDILAEETADQAEYRAFIRDHVLAEGVIVTSIAPDHEVGSTKFEMYREYKVKVKDVQPHNMLAMRRGEKEEIVRIDFEMNDAMIQSYLESKTIFGKSSTLRSFYSAMLKDAFDRLMRTTLLGEVRLAKKESADRDSIRTFEANLRELLLAAPAGMRPTLGVDPGFRTGCKVVVIDKTGKFLDYHAVFPHQSKPERERAATTIRTLVRTHAIELIAIGNGTASRETEEFIRESIADEKKPPVIVIVNESGASVYSASEKAIEEFPKLDVTVRGAISIGRRLQDPLAELVKIDPKSIGVGQYQHDVDQRLLKAKLAETVESCVNFVGVDVNTASTELLSYVAGINSTLAKNIVAYRDDNGPFRNRQELRKVPKLGPKSFEQSAGFLRIRGGDDPLDNSAVHPESYHVARKMLEDLKVGLEDVSRDPSVVKRLDVKQYVTEAVGEPTLRDIVQELQKPGRDPRAEFRYAKFKEGITSVSDLTPGMELEGVVTNVADFGAFVDIGVHQDGLIHVSQLADRFVSDPRTVVKVGQIVRVKVVEVNQKLQRIALSMKSDAGGPKSPKTGGSDLGQKKRNIEPQYTLDDLRAKFKK